MKRVRDLQFIPKTILIALMLSFIFGTAATLPLGAFDPDVSYSESSEETFPASESESYLPVPLFLPVLSDPSDPSGFFFAAEKIRTQASEQKATLTEDQQKLIEWMYEIAFRFAKNPAGQEAGKSLLNLLSSQKRLNEAAAIAREWIQAFGPDWNIYRSLYDFLMAQNSPQDALNIVAEISKAMPSAAKNRSTELSWMEYSARAAIQDYSWASNGPPYIRTRTPDSYIAKIYRLYAAAPNVPQDLAYLALFRAAATEKNYAEAVANALPILTAFSAPDTMRQWITELGRSFYGAGAWKEGIAFFSQALNFPVINSEGVYGDRNSEARANTKVNNEPQLPPLDRERIPSENSWVMAFHLARMYQRLEQNQTAASLFIELVPISFSAEDSDSALWYWLDITMKSIAATGTILDDLGEEDANALHAKRALEISALSQAAVLWKSPSYFEDIVSEYMRRLLREGAWNDVVRLCALMSQKLTGTMRGPLLYISGRLFETGRANVDLALNSANLYYEMLLRDGGIEEHYRTLASWRLGIEPPLLANLPVLGTDFDLESAIAGLCQNSMDPPVDDGKLKDVLDFIGQSLDYGLETLASEQIAALSPYSTDSLLWLAMKFIQHEQYYPALRIGREALGRKSFDRQEIGYALVYPRAWPEHFGEITAPRGIAEPLAYAIVRSESLFNQRAVSRSGAMGLSQLLPSTAAETAKGLKMNQYTLFDPRDNLTIGLTYYGYMLERFDRKPARAIAAYNAGPTRMAQWVRDWGNIEDDILIELYPIAEPRQYTKNITSTALCYGKLYYGISAKDMLDFIYGVKPLPEPTQESPVSPETTCTASAAATTLPASLSLEPAPSSTPDTGDH
ncbi:MAG: lytic transglycosylase domain-containing protein [Rectinema sp.]